MSLGLGAVEVIPFWGLDFPMDVCVLNQEVHNFACENRANAFLILLMRLAQAGGHRWLDYNEASPCLLGTKLVHFWSSRLGLGLLPPLSSSSELELSLSDLE